MLKRRVKQQLTDMGKPTTEQFKRKFCGGEKKEITISLKKMPALSVRSLTV